MMSTNHNDNLFFTRENPSCTHWDVVMGSSKSKKMIADAAPRLAYMKMMKEHVENTPSLSAENSKTETLNFYNSKIRELEEALVEEGRQKMMTEARSKLTTIRSEEELDNLLVDARGEPRYSCTLHYSYGAGKTPMKDYKFFNSSKEVSDYISRLVEAYPGVYPKGGYILPTSSFLDEMFSISNSSMLNINKEKNGEIPPLQFTSKRINY